MKHVDVLASVGIPPSAFTHGQITAWLPGQIGRLSQTLDSFSAEMLREAVSEIVPGDPSYLWEVLGANQDFAIFSESGRVFFIHYCGK